MEAAKGRPSDRITARERVQHHFSLLLQQGLTPNEAALKAIELAQHEAEPTVTSSIQLTKADCISNHPVCVPLEAWMRHLPPQTLHRSLCELALPGAHNAGASSLKCIPPRALAKYVGDSMAANPLVSMLAQPIASQAAICQSMSIKELLQSGIRVLDLRVGMHEGEIHICHTVVCGLTLCDALQQIGDFLREQQSEIVIVTIKRDWEHPDFDISENWAVVQASVMSMFDDLLAVSAADLAAPFHELLMSRRRAVFLFEMPPCAELMCGVRLTSDIFKKSWSPNMKTVDDLQAILGEWRHSGKIIPTPGCLKLLEVALPGTPASCAPLALETFRDFMAAGDPVHIGALMDFPDAATVRAVLVGNWIESKDGTKA